MIDRERIVDDLFAEAVELKAAEREKLFAELSMRSDTLMSGDVIAEVEALLGNYQRAEESDFLRQPFVSSESDEAEQTLSVGQDFEGYKILRLIDEGGMGEVYLAEDAELNRRVAIKLIKSSLKTKELLRRFHNERQILAGLQHPNIARLFQAGASADRLPFFVMEYVEGEPIDKYADRKNLSITERLKLFRKVCGAVSYAHQNLIVHRDIKPSNILVTEDGEPKLLDFGIAKLLHEADANERNATVTVFRVMTPEYASPEQVKGNSITTATDVYSLGVLLYELLTGERPYKLQCRTANEITKAICEQEPERPSQVISGQLSIASNSQSRKGQQTIEDGQKPIRQQLKLLRGDLDNIILKALRKEPERRYSSVEQFSEDIRRYLEGLPITARKDTFSYRASKFIKRNKFGVVAAALIVLSLAGGIIATTIEARRAQKRFDEVRQLAHSVLFDYHDAIAALPGSLTVRQRLIKDGLQYLDNLSKETGNDTSLLRELAAGYERVAAVQGGVAMSGRGTLLSASNLGDMPGALESLHKALSIRERIFAAEPDNNEVRQELSYCYAAIGFLYVLHGPPDKAVEYLRKATPVMEAQLSADPTNEELQYKLWNLYLGLAKALGNPAVPNLGDTKGAMEYMTKAQSVGEQLISNHPTNLSYQQMLGASYNAFGQMFDGAGKQQEALDSYKKAVAIDQALVKAEPSNMFYQRELAVQFGNVGDSLLEMNDRAGAVENFKQALAIYELMVTADPNDAAILRNTGVGHRNLAGALGTIDRAGAMKNFQKALDIFAVLVTKDASNADFRRQWAYTYLSLSRFQVKATNLNAAVESAQQGIKIEEALVASAPTNVAARNTLALLYRQLGDSDAALGAKGTKQNWSAARDAYQKALDIYQDMKSKGTLSTADAGKPDEVSGEIAKCVEALRKLGAD